MGRTAEERFAEKQDRSGSGPLGCWIWRGALTPQGYGSFWDGERTVRAHRFSWESANHRKVPDGLVVAHLCNQKRCTRPSHLQPMRQWQNAHDAIRDNLCPHIEQGFGHLAERCAAGDPASWRVLDRVIRVIAVWNLRRTDVVEVDDLVQEIAGRLLADDCRAIRIFIGRPNTHLYRYIAESLRNRIADFGRRFVIRSKSVAAEPITFAEPDAELRLLVEQVEEKALTSGPPRDRQRNAAIFRAHYRQGMTAQEIGDSIGMNVKSVETILFRLTAGVREACNDTHLTERKAA